MATDSLLGKTFDEYRIEKPLGTGGMAKVYRALDVKLKRYVALKVIAPDFRADSDYTERFEREAQAIARLEHPNIVQIYRFGESSGMYYMAMQYVEGADLGWLIRDYRSAGEVIPLGDVVRVIQDIGAALDYAHSRDVIHRDVKPGNIMVDQRGRTLLTDFGLALLGDIGTQGAIFGSPHYMAPEQTLSSASVSPQSDIYSLGVTLFEMLTGELPFTGGDAVEISMRHLSEAPPAPSQFNATLPPSLDEVVLRALEKEPFDRYQTGAEFSAALSEAARQFTEASLQVESADQPRPSLVLLPQKVHTRLHPPEAEPPSLSPAPPEPVSPPQAVPDTVRAATVRSVPGSGNSWLRAILFAGALFVLGLLLIVALVLSREGGEVQPTAQDSGIAAQLPSEQPPTLMVLQASLSPDIQPTTIPITLLPILGVPTGVPSPAVPVGAQATVDTAALPGTPPAAAVYYYALLISRRADQSLFITNIGLLPLPLAGLRLGNEQGGAAGTEWGIDQLQNGQCLTLWRADGQMEAPDVICGEVGARLERAHEAAFWRSPFAIYYNETPVGMCDHDNCVVTIAAA